MIPDLLRSGRRRRAALGFVLLAGAGSAPSGSTGPFATGDSGPLSLLFGLPDPPAARTTPDGRQTLAVSSTLANNYSGDYRDDESLLLIGETHQTRIRWTRGLPHRFELGVAVDYLRHQSGFLSEPINAYHDLLGVGGEELPGLSRDQVRFEYERDGVKLLDHRRSTRGFGDTRLRLARQLALPSLADRMAGSLFLSVKLPTGSPSRLTGSGGTDVALGLSLANADDSRRSRLALYGGGGLLVTSRGDVLPDRRRRRAGFAWIGAERKLTPRLFAKVQLDAHTALFRDSAFGPLSGVVVQGVAGLTFETDPSRSWDFSLSEDLTVGDAPDVQIQIAHRWRP